MDIREGNEQMSKTTLKEVADKAGVSMTTASFAFSGKGRISSEVRDLVLRTAKELGYKRMPTFSKEKDPTEPVTIAMLLDIRPWEELIWHLLNPVLTELDSSLLAKGFFPVILPVTNALSMDELVTRLMLMRSKGVFVFSNVNEELISHLEGLGIPAVIILNNELQEKYSTAGIDDFQAAYEGTQHLLRLGHRDILYLCSGAGRSTSTFTDRLYGFQKALGEYGVEFKKEKCIDIEKRNPEELRRRLKELINKKSRPTAVFAYDDHLAVEAVAYLTEMELKIPDDVSIIAPGDLINYSEPYVPKISTFQVDPVQIGRIASHIMMERLNGKESHHQVVKVRQRLVDRGSCREITPQTS